MMGGLRQLKGTMPKELGLEGTVEGLEGQTLFAQGIFDGKPTDPGQIALVLGPRVAGSDVEGVAFEKAPTTIRRNIFFRILQRFDQAIVMVTMDLEDASDLAVAVGFAGSPAQERGFLDVGF